MISVVVCSKKDASYKTHRNHIAATVGCDHEYIRIDNTQNRYGICAAYNQGIEEAAGDTVVFVHEDVFIVTPNWGTILEQKFNQDSTVGLIGVAGTQYLFEDLPLWFAAGCPFIKGQVVHDNIQEKRCILSVYSEEKTDAEVVVVDGLFFAARKLLFSSLRFDEKTFDKFHFYDLDVCMQARKTHKILVTPQILVKHFSSGTFNGDWKLYGAKFALKYKKSLPASCIDAVPDTEKRIPFESYPLESIMSPQTYAYVKDLGREPSDNQQAETAAGKNLSDIIAVTGMHRSGTSAVAGLLSKCGFDIGPVENLLNKNEPYFDNQKGYFENSTVLKINETILHLAGGAWDRVPSSEEIACAAERVKTQIALFAQNFTGTIIKEPRLCLTLDIWRKQCPRIKYIIICLRHPLSIAKSLHERNSIPLEAGLQLWYDYNTRLIDSLQNIPSLVIDYDNLLDHLEDDLFDIIRILHSSLSREEMCRNIKGFFEKDLNHNPIKKNEMVLLPDDVKDLYDILRQNSISVRMGRKRFS